MKFKFTFALPVLVVALLLFDSCTYFGFGSNQLVGEKAITPELIKKHVYYLASDALKGRNTPSAELDTAAHYIADEFKACGLQPVNDSYFQKVNLAIVNLGPDNHLKITRNGEEKSFRIKEEFTPFEITANKEVNAQIVFAGYGITAPEYNYDDYTNIDVNGKIVFVLRHEPGEEDSGSIFNGIKPTDYSNVKEKVRIAKEHGAIGVLVATDPLNHTSLTPRGFPWLSLSKNIPEDAIPMNLSFDEDLKIPVVHVGEEVINLLFGSVEKLKEIQVELDSMLNSKSFEIPDAVVSVKTSTKVKEMPTQNVVGIIVGTDPVLKDEIIIIGAHYDHVGYKKNQPDTTDIIFNGADDNASVTSGVLAIAAGFAAMKQKPKRTVLFLTFAGEEKGLLGSTAYIEKPLFPLNKTVAMLNLDMIGRNGEDTLYIIGQPQSPDLVNIIVEENKYVGMALIFNQEKNIGGSDHVSFSKKKIHSIFYHTGIHADYHRVTDNPEFINFKKAAKVARLAFRTAWNIANHKK